MLAAVFGILSAMLMFAFLSNRGGSGNSVDKALNGAGGFESAVVIAQDVPFGTVITNDMVSVQSVPRAALIDGHITDSTNVVGKIATAPLFKGQQIVDRQFTTFEGQNTLTYKVPEGMRAVSLQVPSEGWIVGGLPQPGDHIDFLAITSLSRTDPLTGQERPDVVSGVIAQNVEILAVAQTMVKTIPKLDKPAASATGTPGAAATTAAPAASGSDAKPLDNGATYEKAISVTLALPPDLAAKVSLVDAMKKDVGQYRLLLRRQGDNSDVSQKTYTYDDIFPAKK
jgi:Flp pilus assembly protein CpaB